MLRPGTRRDSAPGRRGRRNGEEIPRPGHTAAEICAYALDSRRALSTTIIGSASPPFAHGLHDRGHGRSRPILMMVRGLASAEGAEGIGRRAWASNPCGEPRRLGNRHTRTIAARKVCWPLGGRPFRWIRHRQPLIAVPREESSIPLRRLGVRGSRGGNRGSRPGETGSDWEPTQPSKWLRSAKPVKPERSGGSRGHVAGGNAFHPGGKASVGVGFGRGRTARIGTIGIGSIGRSGARSDGEVSGRLASRPCGIRSREICEISNEHRRKFCSGVVHVARGDVPPFGLAPRAWM